MPEPSLRRHAGPSRSDLPATAIEAVLEAGRIQLASFGKDGLQIDKKGAIDLVTEVDVAVERLLPRLHRRALPRPRASWPRSWAAARAAGSAARHCWIYDPIDGTTNFAHGLPIFSVVAGARD